MACPSCAFCNVMNVLSATNKQLASDCSLWPYAREICMNFIRYTSLSRLFCLPEWKTVFFPDLIKTNSFCPSSSRYQKNTTDKVARLVTVSLIECKHVWYSHLGDWKLHLRLQWPQHYMYLCNFFCSAIISSFCCREVCMLLDPSKKRPVLLMLVTGKGSVLFCFKNAFSLQ